MNRLIIAFALLLIAFAILSEAGWNDMTYSSPQNGMEIRQGDNISLTLQISNRELLDGGAAYLANITLVPGPCINGGQNITLPGGIVCPNNSADTGCAARFRNATIKDTYVFENLATQENCQNGEYSFIFALSGSTEIGAGGDFARGGRLAAPRFAVRLIGPHFCGDGTCEGWKGENCSSCAQDCGPCPVCEPGARTCANDSIGDCNASGSWRYSPCPGGCKLNITDEPECLPPCTPGANVCIAENVLAVCEDYKWHNESCSFGCLYDDCKGNCVVAGCPEFCASARHLSNGTCNQITGKCTYSDEYCAKGCDSAGVKCEGAATPVPKGGGGFDLLLPAVALLAVLAVGAFAYFKFMKKPSGGMPPSSPPPGPPPAAKPAAPEQKPPSPPSGGAPSPFKSIHEQS